MTLAEPWETSLGLKNTSAESTVRRSGSAKSAPRNTLFNLTGKPITRFVGLDSTNVTVARYSPGIYSY